ncbi:hypothetical protein WP1_039 [Pseudomonas phage WP1]
MIRYRLRPAIPIRAENRFPGYLSAKWPLLISFRRHRILEFASSATQGRSIGRRQFEICRQPV